MSRRRCGPGTNGGRGFVECAATGFPVRAQDVVADVRQGDVGAQYADITPGFGTWHPRDRYDVRDFSDPTPIVGGGATPDADHPSGDPIDPDFVPPTLEGAPTR